jgi:hypothetical protein
MSEAMRTLLVGVGARGKIWARLLREEPTTTKIGYVDVDESNLAWMQGQHRIDA